MNYSREQLIDALIGEYHAEEADGMEMDMSVDEYRSHLETLTLEQLIKETSWDTEEEILDFIYAYDQ